jgi:membrane-bound lytic murein transglycosylase F
LRSSRHALTVRLLAAALLAAWLPAADLPQVKERGTLRVLVVFSDEEYFFFSAKPGTPPGFDQELLTGFADLQKLKLEVVPVTGWDALIPWLLKGKGDLIAGGFTATDTRRKQIAFTTEVFPTRNVVITRKPHRVVATLAQLKEEKVGTIRGTSMAEDLSTAGIQRVDVSLEAGQFVRALRDNKITAAVDGVEAALRAKLADPELQIGMFLGPPRSLAYGVRNEDAELLRTLDAYVGNLRKTPAWSRLAVKYFGEAAPEILREARKD